MAKLTYISSAEIVYDAKNAKLKFMVTFKTADISKTDVSPISLRTVRIPIDDPELRDMKFITQ